MDTGIMVLSITKTWRKPLAARTTAQGRRRGAQGSTLMIVVVVTALVGFVLAAYLTLLSANNRATYRSQAWNATVAVIEAGIEDAMAHLNSHGTTNLACDGWAQTGDYYHIKRYIGDHYYVVAISNWVAGSSNRPVIESRGFVTTPMMSAQAQPNFMIASGGGTPGVTYLGRGIRATAAPAPMFIKAMVAKGEIDLAGNNIKTDSFDSSDTNYCTNGRYDAAKNKEGGDVATNSGLTNSLDVGNADVYGKVSTGPGGSVTLGPNGCVGDKGWHVGSVNNGKIQPGWSTDDMNMDFPDVPVPFTGGYNTPKSGTVGTVNYNYLLTGGNYQMTTLNMSGKEQMYISADTVLYVTGNVSISGQAGIELAPGVTCKLYVGGASASIGGNGIINKGYAANFYYYGMPSNKDLAFAGNSSFTGVIYAPNAAFHLGGGGSDNYDFVGSSITSTVKMNGHFSFHYDEALKHTGPRRGYVVTGWNEMTPGEVDSLPLALGY